jgi:prepilin-type N-terminal cleavage/methylation domain-containing protein
MRKRKQQSGFSAVELVVVTCVIGILASVAYPKFAIAKDNASNSRVQNNAHKVQLALEEYGSDHGGNYPETVGDVVDLVVKDKDYNPTGAFPPTPWDTQQTAAIAFPNPAGGTIGDSLGTGSSATPSVATHYGAISYLQVETGRYYLAGTGKHADRAIVAAFCHN